VTREDVLARVTSICAGSPFLFTLAVSPFGFTQQPTGQIDGVFRVVVEQGEVVGGFSYTEERTDRVTVWVARKQQADAQAAYDRLLADVSSIRSAVIHSGVLVGDFAVPDGGSTRVEHEAGREFAVAELTIPVNYELTV
jgi:hypothetical protein